MGIDVRIAYSDEMKRNMKAVSMMTGRMGFDENMLSVNWKAVRRLSGMGYKLMHKEKGVKFRKTRIAGVECMAVVPPEVTSRDIIMYIHGGGFVSGSAEDSKGYCSMLANYSGCNVISVDYSLSPESKFPTAVNECAAVYEFLAERFPESRISLIGESAGGNLCLTTTHKVMADGCRKPHTVNVHSPVVDFSGSFSRDIHPVDDFTVKKGCLAPLREIYVGDGDVKDCLVSPIFGDFRDFPPLLITCDSNETLYADSFYLHQKAEENGVEVQLIEMRGAFHAFAAIGTGAPETLEILKDNIKFIKADHN